jgi:hypothetical protein
MQDQLFLSTYAIYHERPHTIFSALRRVLPKGRGMLARESWPFVYREMI